MQLWKTQTQKIHKQSCTVFRKLMCVQTQRSSGFFKKALPILKRSLSLLQKKPSDSQKKPFDLWKKPSDLWHSCTADAFLKNVMNVGIIFFDTYHNLQFTIPYLVLTVCASCWHVFTATILVSPWSCYIWHAMVCSPYSKTCSLPTGQCGHT